MSMSSKDIQKRALIKKTVSEMNQQIQKLEKQKEFFINAAKEAKQMNLTEQYDLAMNSLKITMLQQKRVFAMKMNFEITSQMRDMANMTADFLQGMALLSKDMARLTKEKDFKKVEKDFSEAMTNAEASAEMMDSFLNQTNLEMASVATLADDSILQTNKKDSAELEKAMESVESLENDIDREIAELQKKIGC